MKRPRLRALVLAAGYGNRLRPLTLFTPKPLLPVCGRPAVLHTIERLVEIGCEAIAINLFHNGDQIRSALGESRGGVPLTYSLEAQLLGTLGALTPLREFLAVAEAVLVVNGDSLCNWPFAGLLRRHVQSRAVATLLVSKRIDPHAFGGGVGVIDHRWISSLRPGAVAEAEAGRRVFMGAHVLAPKLLERCPDGPADFIADLYEPLLAEGAEIAALESARRWHDLGTPERYRRGVLDWTRGRGWRATDAEIAGGARVKRSVIEARVRVEERSAVGESVILPGARIGRDSRVSASIIGPGVELPPQSTIEHRLVTRTRADAEVSTEASVVGGLVYDPI